MGLMDLIWVLVFASSLTISSASEDQIYIVRVANDLKPSAFPNVEHWYRSTLRSLSSNVQDDSSEFKNTVSADSSLIHTYRIAFHGFASYLTLQQVEELKSRSEVLAVYPNRILQIQTTRSLQFLGLSSSKKDGIYEESNYGANVIIGLLDTGIWPERVSFNDGDLDPVPVTWKGECVEGQNFTKNDCNKKVIGARWFYSNRFLKPEGYLSARDSEGHGTHTASTAAGRSVEPASLFGFASGVASGIAPKSRVAIYKVCWPKGCSVVDILAAYDKAIEDGVNVISFSVGSGPGSLLNDPVSVATFGAMEHGVFVSAAGGNEGPGSKTVSNIAPWVTTVGASTIDRSFPADLLLGDGTVLKGASLYKGAPLPKAYIPIVYGGNISLGLNGTVGRGHFKSSLCMTGSLDPKLARGKIVMCDRGTIPRVLKGDTVKKAGGIGMVLSNVEPAGEGLIADSFLLPALAITQSGADAVHRYLNMLKDPKATIVFHGTQVGVKPSPVVAGFSSRGPTFGSSYVIKPDVIAPGVNILAAWPDGVGPTELSSDTRHTDFNILSGTSMACPHVSGIAALLKGAHQDWSPARIRSAMMTTAYVVDMEGKPFLDEVDYNVSTVFDYGSGHVDPEKAVDPGLVFDLTADDYVNFLCASNYSQSDIKSLTRREADCSKTVTKPWDLNYPSISVSFTQFNASKYEATLTRTATNVGEGASTYKLTTEAPAGTTVSVEPTQLVFSKAEEKQRFVVKITTGKVDVALGDSESVFGRMTWTDGNHVVGMPIAVIWHPNLYS